MGRPNYHNASPGIDQSTRPSCARSDFDSDKLVDAWPLDNSNPKRYLNASHVDEANGIFAGMYTIAGECGLSSPRWSTTLCFLHDQQSFNLCLPGVSDGTLLWWDDLGMQTDGYNGGYGYCLGAAIWKMTLWRGRSSLAETAASCESMVPQQTPPAK